MNVEIKSLYLEPGGGQLFRDYVWGVRELYRAKHETDDTEECLLPSRRRLQIVPQEQSAHALILAKLAGYRDNRAQTTFIGQCLFTLKRFIFEED